MMGRLHMDLFLQDRFVLNLVNVKIRIVRSKDSFVLMAGGANPDFKVLSARNSTLSPAFHMAHIKAPDNSTANYLLRQVDCKMYSIPQGALSHIHENLFLVTLRKYMVLCCIENDAYYVWYAKNPFHTKHNDIDFLIVYVDGRQVPAKPLHPNFVKDQFVRSYVNLFSFTGKTSQQEGNGPRMREMNR